MSGLRLTGLASGLDSDSVVEQLMAIERQPRTRTARQQVGVQARQDSLRQIDSKLTSLKLATGDLRSALVWLPSQTTSSSNEAIVTAKRLAGAAPGGYQVNVQTLASADSRTYDWVDGGGDLAISYKDDGVTKSKPFDLAGKSLDEAVTAINNADDSPVWAVNVAGRLSLSRKQTGDHANWGFDASGTAVGALSASRDGVDSTYTIAGDATVYSSHTSVASNGLPGIELTLKGIGSATVNVSTPAVDRDQIATKLKAFVSAYNDAIDLVRGKVAEKPVANPTTDTDAKLGGLFGDTALNGLLTTMRRTVAEAGLESLGVKVAATGAGTSPDALAGKLSFDSTAFNAAWDKSPTDVQAKLGSTTTSGFAQRLEAILGRATRAGDGLVDQRIGAADRELAVIKDKLARLDTRLATRKDYLQRQFASLEQTLSRSQSQSTDLASRLGQTKS
jgi:flagellar hook-associated protein 2